VSSEGESDEKGKELHENDLSNCSQFLSLDVVCHINTVSCNLWFKKILTNKNIIYRTVFISLCLCCVQLNGTRGIIIYVAKLCFIKMSERHFFSP